MDNFPETRAEGFEGQRLVRLPRQVLDRVRQHPFTRDFLLTDLGYFPPSAGHRVIRNKGIREWILIFVHAGSGWCRIGKQKHNLISGQAVLIAPGKAHAYGAQQDDPWSIFWFHFSGRGATGLLRWSNPELQSKILRMHSPGSLRRHFNSILSAVENGYHEHTLLELSRSLVNVLALMHRNPRCPVKNSVNARIEASMNRIRETLNQPCTLREYARDCHLSVAQYSFLFKEHAGISPMTYRTELRMQRACDLLETTNLSIKAIAHHVGYPDPLHFSRAFKACTGHSPSAYRQAKEAVQG